MSARFTPVLERLRIGAKENPKIDDFATYQKSQSKKQRISVTESKWVEIEEPKQKKTLLTKDLPPTRVDITEREKTLDDIVNDLRNKGVDIPDISQSVEPYLEKLDPKLTGKKNGFNLRDLKLQAEALGLTKTGSRAILINNIKKDIQKRYG